MPQILGPESFLHAARDTGRTLRARYDGDPVGLAERFGLKLPEKPVFKMLELGVITEAEARDRFGEIEKGLRDLVIDVCLGVVTDAVAVGPRGGGKSQGVSFIEFYLVFIAMYDALNLGGSELQADQVYQYLLSYIDSDPYWRTLLKGDPLITKTETVNDNWIRVLTASSKSVRSPHAGGWKARQQRFAGGILVIDEEAETEADIVDAALYTINTARPSVNVRCSTFHKIDGSFAEVVDSHEEMGYTLYRWDIFDVCSGCNCGPRACESPEPCFREDHYETFTDPETGQEAQKLVHKAYCGGRARYATGWVPMDEILKTWRRAKRSHTKFEVEAMGSRPSTKGYVIKDHTAFNRNITSRPANELYIPGHPVTICIDWGTVAAGVECWQEQFGDRHALLECELLEENTSESIEGTIYGFAQKYLQDLDEIAADIGGGGNYMNPRLEAEYGFTVRGVNFNEEKEAAAAAWNIYNEAGLCDYPAEFTEFIHQCRMWKRKKGRIAKGNDHLPDTAICYFSKFIDRLGISTLRVAGTTFASGSVMENGKESNKMDPEDRRTELIEARGGRVPIILGLGKR